VNDFSAGTGRRRLIVGVVGGDDNMRGGEELGREIARRGWILLTGGQLMERSLVEATGAVKDAAMLGAVAADDGARLAGILPSILIKWRRPSARRLFLDTGLPHNVRNVINGRTPDVVVAFGCSQGTLAEIAF
jgi:predicted Rossmann-fold nucleotide-binding protein